MYVCESVCVCAYESVYVCMYVCVCVCVCMSGIEQHDRFGCRPCRVSGEELLSQIRVLIVTFEFEFDCFRQ